MNQKCSHRGWKFLFPPKSRGADTKGFTFHCKKTGHGSIAECEQTTVSVHHHLAYGCTLTAGAHFTDNNTKHPHMKLTNIQTNQNPNFNRKYCRQKEKHLFLLFFATCFLGQSESQGQQTWSSVRLIWWHAALSIIYHTLCPRPFISPPDLDLRWPRYAPELSAWVRLKKLCPDSQKWLGSSR